VVAPLLYEISDFRQHSFQQEVPPPSIALIHQI